MALVSNNPGEEDGAIGVITLEDVIEELIGEVMIMELLLFLGWEEEREEMGIFIFCFYFL